MSVIVLNMIFFEKVITFLISVQKISAQCISFFTILRASSVIYGELRYITFLPVVLHFNFLFCGLFKVMKEVCSNGNGVVDCDGAGSGSPVHKAELEKVWIHNYIYVNYICVFIDLLCLQRTCRSTYMQVCESVCWFACLPASPHLSTQHRRLFSVFLYSGSAAREWRAIKASFICVPNSILPRMCAAGKFK